MKKIIYNHDYNTSNYFFICNQIKKNTANHFLYFYLPFQQDFLDHLFMEKPINSQSKICYQLFRYRDLSMKQYNELKIPIYKKILYYFFNISRSIHYLLDAQIIVNLKESNIIFHGDSVYLTNFFDSLSLVNYNNNHGKFQFKNLYNYCSWEFFICNQIFVKQNMDLTSLLSEEEIQNIIDDFLEYHILFKFEITINNHSYEYYFKREAQRFLTNFLNKPVQTLVDNIFKHYKKWDCYALVSYILIKFNESQISDTSTITKMEKCKDILINTCLQIDPEKRSSMDEINNIIEIEFSKS